VSRYAWSGNRLREVLAIGEIDPSILLHVAVGGRRRGGEIVAIKPTFMAA
jgi:hypothetical protein